MKESWEYIKDLQAESKPLDHIPTFCTPYLYKAKLVRVVDGDTVKCNIDLGFDVCLTNQTLRLYGINAPESRTRDKEEKVRGLAAKARLKELLKENKNKFFIESHDKGKFGRILATIWSDEFMLVSVNHVLVREGHAVEYFGGKR